MLYIILIRFSRRFQIWLPKYEIYSVVSATATFNLSATLWEIWLLPNVDDLHIILIRILRRFWIWLPKFKIHSVAPATLYRLLCYFDKQKSKCEFKVPQEKLKMVWLAEKNNSSSISWCQAIFFKVEYFLICLNVSLLTSSLKLVPKMAITGVMEWISNFSDQIQNLLENLIRMIYRLSTFGNSQISCNVAEIHSVAPATAIFLY